MRRLFDAFEAAGRELWLVGGAVRDHLLGRPLEALADLDFATDASPDESLRILRLARLSTHAVGKHFGTVGAVLRGPRDAGYPKDVQITTFRPSVDDEAEGQQVGSSLLDDLSRRDFTINAIALGPNLDVGAAVDPHGGRADLAARLIRAVGDPERMLRDDPLRLLRIGRFVATLGFDVDAELAQAARRRAPSILDTSRERWLQEMDKLLIGPHADRGLEVLRDCRALAMVLPEVVALVGLHESSPVHHKDVWAHTLGVLRQTPAEPVLRWTALLHDVGKAWTRTFEPTEPAEPSGSGDADPTVRFIGHEALSALLFEGIAARFRFDKRSAARIGFLIAEHGLPEAYGPDWSDSAVRRLARRAGEHLDDLLTFARADLTTRFDHKREAVHERIDELAERIASLERADALRPRLPKGLGVAIMRELGLSEGPAVGKAVERVTQAVIDGRLPGSPSIEQCLRELVKGEG